MTALSLEPLRRSRSVATIVGWVEPIRASTALTTEADALVHVPEKHALAKARGDTGFCDKACPREGWGHAPLEMKLSVSRVRSNEIRSSPDKQASTKSARCGFVIRAILASSPSRGCVSVVRMLGAARGKGAAFFHGGVSCASIANSTTSPAFDVTRKRRKSFPSETHVKRGRRLVHGGVELVEKLGRNDLCPCGSGRRFQSLLPRVRPLRRCQSE